ncbi:hypothetical protein PBI_INGRID_61 [Arthrobacter phage Ingrid]|nr:hypothetical protein PBI_INGRID_61 [Arthrobacter phage Ingrid]QFG11040.1 hypothetical protein PBI_LORETTA_58 [Arthrobacter phage Loretta]
MIHPSSLIWRSIPLDVPIKENVVKKEVVFYTCDNCPAEDEAENPKSWKKPLPVGWVDLNVVSNDGVLVSKHLCDTCWTIVHEALIKREEEAKK